VKAGLFSAASARSQPSLAPGFGHAGQAQDLHQPSTRRGDLRAPSTPYPAGGGAARFRPLTRPPSARDSRCDDSPAPHRSVRRALRIGCQPRRPSNASVQEPAHHLPEQPYVCRLKLLAQPRQNLCLVLDHSRFSLPAPGGRQNREWTLRHLFSFRYTRECLIDHRFGL
jgi:hypothetical protein